jgi:hypothetical protein
MAQEQALEQQESAPQLVDLDRQIFRPEQSSSGLSGLLLAGLAVPIIVFMFWLLSMQH